jgi:hypothetical protein
MQLLIITSRLKKQNKKSVGYDGWIHSYYYPHTVGYSIWFYVCRPKVAKHKLKQVIGLTKMILQTPQIIRAPTLQII